MEYYDDNFGHWHDTTDSDVADFYHHVQSRNVKTVCRRCERTVMIQPDYDLCNSCADAEESGLAY